MPGSAARPVNAGGGLGYQSCAPAGAPPADPHLLRHSMLPSRCPHRRTAAVLALAAAALLGACDDVAGPQPAPLSARWESPATGSGALTGAPIALVLEQRDAAVTGSGTVQHPSGALLPVSVVGSITGRVVTLELDAVPPATLPSTLLLQAMLAEDEQRLTGAITLGELTEVRYFQRR